MNPYRDYLNRIAYKSLTRINSAPDITLAVGDDENMISHVLSVNTIPKNTIKAATAPNLKSVAYELAATDGQNEKISEKDFPKTYYLGEPLMGV